MITFLCFLAHFTLFTSFTLPSRLTHTRTSHTTTLLWFLTVDGTCLTAVLAKIAHVTFCNYKIIYVFTQTWTTNSIILKVLLHDDICHTHTLSCNQVCKCNFTLFTIFTLPSRLTHTRTIHRITLLWFLTDFYFTLFTIFTLLSRLTYTRTIHMITLLLFLIDFNFTLFTIFTLLFSLTHTRSIHMITLSCFLTDFNFALFTIFTLPSRLTHTGVIHVITLLWFLTDFNFTLFQSLPSIKADTYKNHPHDHTALVPDRL